MSIDADKLLLQRAYYWEKERGDDIYLTQPFDGGQVDKFSWKRILDEARRMANYLKEQDFPEKSHIGILSKNCAHFIMTDLAIWMAGHVSVAMYPTLNEKTASYIIDHSEIKLLFVGKLDNWDTLQKAVPDDLPCVSYPLSPPNDFPTWKDLIKETDPIDGSPTREKDDLAILIYTSGSTGQPKGVMLTFGNMAFAGWNFGEFLDINEKDRMLSYLPLAHSFERAALESLSISKGCKVFFAESLDTFPNDLQRAAPTVFHSVPRLWLKFRQKVFAKLPEKKFNFLMKIPLLNRVIKKKILRGLGLQECRMAVSGSAPIPPDLIQWYRDLGLELLEGYGMSENFAYSHVSRPGRSRVGYVGEPLPGVDCRISDAGEIQVKSPTTMEGYFKNEEKTKEVFTDDEYLKTGDRGEVDSEGRLRITGRVKELFKTSKGKYIAPAPIENLISAHSMVEQSCVTGSGFPQAHAVVLLAEDIREKLDKGENGDLKKKITSEMEKLVEEVNKEVEHHEEIKFIALAKEAWTIESGFLTPTMKIKRNVLEDTYGPLATEWYEADQKVIWE